MDGMSFLQRLVGMIDVEENGNYITVYNLRTELFRSDLLRVWNTSKIYKHMFKEVKRNKIVFHKFFAIEFYFLMRSIKATTERTYTKKAVCDKIIDLLYENTWLQNVKHVFGDIINREKQPDITTGLNYSALNKFSSTPLPHQSEFFEIYALHKKAFNLQGFYLTAPPGSGKTLTSLMLREMLGLDKHIVVCPKNAVERAWISDIKKHYKKTPVYWGSDSGDNYVNTNAEIIIVHYDALPMLLREVNKLKKYKCLVTLDEGHNLNNPDSLRTKLFTKICDELTSTEDKIWASGTPIKAVGTEAIPFINTIDASFDSYLAERFKKMYGTQSRALSELLANRLGLKTYTVPKSNIIDSEPIYETIKIKMPNGDKYTLESIAEEMQSFIKQQVEFYEKNKQKFEDDYNLGIRAFESRHDAGALLDKYNLYKRNINLIKKTRNYSEYTVEMKYCNDFEKNYIETQLRGSDLKDFRNAKSVVKYVMLKIRGEVLGRILGKRREECHVDMVKYAGMEHIVKDAQSKTIIFTSYKNVVSETMDYFNKLKFNPIEVSGDTNNNLTSIVKRFEADEKINPLVATLQSLSTAVPMTMANTLIFVNKPFRVHEFEQAVARAWRLGQKFQVYVFNLELDTGDKPNINTRSSDIMEWSKEQVNILTGVTAEISMESSELDLNRLLKRVTMESNNIVSSLASSNWR